MDNLDAFLREHGGLQSLARELGQDDPNARLFAPGANDDDRPEPVRLWRRIVRLLLRGNG